MNIIKDKETKLGTIYERLSSKDNAIIQRVATFGFIKQATKSQLSYFMIMNIYGHPFYEANYYLNKILANESFKNRERAYNALKLLYTYIQLFSVVDYKTSFSIEKVKELITFLEGGHQIGNTITLDLKKSRNKSTINSYFGIYREFYKSMFPTIDSTIFKLKTSRTQYNKFYSKEQYAKEQKLSGLSTAAVPMYIKEHEYEKIIGLINEKYTIREHIMVDLMYLYGLRIGEVLGLTIEDIDYYNNEYILKLRNRVSDKPYQRAKGCITPKTREDYITNKALKENNKGIQTITIDSDLAELIDEYIDETRNPKILSSSPKKKHNIETKAIADRIDTTPLNGENTYLFLNHQHCTPLTQAGWNYVLRDIYEKSGITVDKDVRLTNLSHRFRHGFAMYWVKQGKRIHELQKLLRHRDPSSCAFYYNPDEEDKIELQEKVAKRRQEQNDFDKSTS